MTEREPAPSPIEDLPDQGPDAAWGREALGEVLDTPPLATHDVGWGDGTRYLVRDGADQRVELQIFPTAGVVQITSQHAQLTLYRQTSPSLSADRVRFAQPDADTQLDATLTRHGRLELTITPLPASAATPDDGPSLDRSGTDRQHPTQPVEIVPNSPPSSPESTEIAPGVATPLVARPGRAEGDVRPPAPTGESTDRQERPSQRLTLAGRLGRLPAFRTTSGGTLIASFPLAVKDEAGQTTWHTVRVFGERAEKLREGLAKGQHLEVIGYLHQHERTTRAGEPRLVEEIYATVVTPR